MPIAISADHIALAESVRSLTKRFLPSDELHAALNATEQSCPGYWQAAAEMGLFGLHIPEADGGQGFGFAELVVVIEEFGRSAAPGPFVPTVFASALIAAGGNHTIRAELLPLLSTGALRAAVALESSLVGKIEHGKVTVSGIAQAVVSAESAEIFVLPIHIDDAVAWVVVDATNVKVTGVDSVDPLRPVGNVEVTSMEFSAERVLANLDTRRVRNFAGLLYSAEAAGVAIWCTQTATDYAKMREQFGRPIGQFQAIKHKCALMLVEAERASAAVWDAARAMDGDNESEAEFAVAIAATLAPSASLTTAQNCIQVLGGIGFTWEHDAHIFYRRAIGIGAALGRPSDWSIDVARATRESGVRAVNVELSEDADSRRAEIRAEIDKLALFEPIDQLRAIADGGWVLPHLPKPWGRDADAVDQVIIHQEFRAAKIARPEIALAAWMVPSIVTYGSEEQKQKFLPETLSGDLFWCQLFSEPGAGSDLASLTTKAVKVDGGWRLTGSKIWNSLAQFADMGFCLARTDPDAPKHGGITYFLVDMKSAGVDVRPLRELTGSALFNQVFLDEVFVPDENVVGEVNQGWEVTRNTLSNERVSLSNKDLPLYAGLDDLVQYLGESEPDSISQDRLGHLIAEGQAVRLLNLRSTMLQLDGSDPGTSSSVSKLLNMRFGQEAAEFVHSEFGVCGAIASESQAAGRWASFMLASRATTIYGGTTEIQLNIIGERILGLPRDPVVPEQ